MNWNLDNLTPEQARSVWRSGYVGAFYKVIMPRLLAMEPPKTEPDATLPLPDADAQPLNKYVPLAPDVPATPRPTPRPASTPRVARLNPPSNPMLSSSDAIGGGRFAPGVIVAERYRIVAILGRGGMGEVYRAEDLKLSQVVAIEFLPEALSRDAGALARFHSEVRIARQVSHPNVCRAFDIGDVEGTDKARAC